MTSPFIHYERTVKESQRYALAHVRCPQSPVPLQYVRWKEKERERERERKSKGVEPLSGVEPLPHLSRRELNPSPSSHTTKEEAWGRGRGEEVRE